MTAEPPPNVPLAATHPVIDADPTLTAAAQEMAVYATPEETAAFLMAQGSPRLLVFTEDRSRPVRRTDALPKIWLSRLVDARARFVGDAAPGEFYVFQIAVYNNTDTPMGVLSATLNLPGIAGSHLHCLNFEARPNDEPPLRDGLPLPPHALKVLWMAVEMPLSPVERHGAAIVVCRDSVTGRPETLAVPVSLTVVGAPTSGVNDAWRLSRLKWLLPSDLGNEPTPTKGYAAVTRRGSTIGLNGKTLQLDSSGLPAQVVSHFSGSNTRIEGDRRELLKSPARFVVETEDGPVTLKPEGGVRFTEEGAGGVSWTARSRGGALTLDCEGRVEFDGYVTYRLRLTAARTIDLTDIRLEVPYRADAAKFVMGLGERGGLRTKPIDWKWDLAKYQDRIWLGDVNIGAQWKFYGSDYRLPLVNIYYPYRPLVLPDSWANSGRGGVIVRDDPGGAVTLVAYGGGRRLGVGQSLDFNAQLLLTPFHALETDKQWATRFYHPIDTKSVDTDGKALAHLKTTGANYINVHQAEPLNPFINYPFNDVTVPELAKFAADAHAQGDRVGVYYTTRELTKNLPEFFALTQLDGAVIQPGPGPLARTLIHPNGPAKWLNDNLSTGFIPAWYQALGGKYAGMEDISVLTTPDGPWNNFYLNGLDWLAERAQIDGLYIDDAALDRRTLLRARRILEARRPDPMIDLHSWNPFSTQDSHYVSASLYMDLMPFIDRLWFGEAANYDQSPDAWLVQYSCIPYGLMSEMLYGGANRWRGLVFGMTGRLGHGDDPQPFWRAWDSFGLQGAEMIGWWDPDCPVKTGNAKVPATVYRKNGKVLIALASWAAEPVTVHLALDWKALGIDASRAHLRAVSVDSLQSEKTYAIGDGISIAPKGGFLLELNDGCTFCRPII